MEDGKTLFEYRIKKNIFYNWFKDYDEAKLFNFTYFHFILSGKKEDQCFY